MVEIVKLVGVSRQKEITQMMIMLLLFCFFFKNKSFENLK